MDTNPLSNVGFCPYRFDRIVSWIDHWVGSGRLPGALVAVMRHDRLASLLTVGMRDIENEQPICGSTIFRIYSMTKPITTVAALILCEQGKLQLDDAVAKYLPAFANTRVYVGGNHDDYRTEPLQRPITLHDLMVHTSGLTYDFQYESVVDALYRSHQLGFDDAIAPLNVLCERAAGLPLLFQPGTRWNYSIATDILGHIIEVISTSSLDIFFREHIFKPLGMVDTGFFVPQEKLHRLAACYEPAGDGKLKCIDSVEGSRFATPPLTLSGGGGLVSTAGDYLNFCSMLMHHGQFQGKRLLSRKTVELMMMNHLPGDLVNMGQPRFSEMPFAGIGFGLGGAVLLNPARAQILGSPGEFSWGGIASTAFWIDPIEQLIVVFLTQLIPSSVYPLRRQLRTLVYQAIID